MSLIYCSECGKQISENAAICPGCGAIGYHAQGAGWLDKVYAVSGCTLGLFVAFGFNLDFGFGLSTYAIYIKVIGFTIFVGSAYVLVTLLKKK